MHTAVQRADWQMLSARKALGTLCAKYELKYAELARHSAELGLDIRGIDDHAQHIQEVCSLPADCHPTSAILPPVRLGDYGICEQSQGGYSGFPGTVTCAALSCCWDMMIIASIAVAEILRSESLQDAF